MTYPIQISFLNLESSKSVEDIVHRSVEKLSRFYPRIAGVTVTISMPHKSHHKGNTFQVSVEIVVPGQTLCVQTDADNHAEYEDVFAAVGDAFRAARRQLEEYAKRKLDAPKHNSAREKLA